MGLGLLKNLAVEFTLLVYDLVYSSSSRETAVRFFMMRTS
jgi:hypothetical protein